MIFEMEARLAASKRKATGADDVTVNRGKGKVLRREVPPEGNMGTTKSGDDGDEKGEVQPGPRRESPGLS